MRRLLPICFLMAFGCAAQVRNGAGPPVLPKIPSAPTLGQECTRALLKSSPAPTAATTGARSQDARAESAVPVALVPHVVPVVPEAEQPPPPTDEAPPVASLVEEDVAAGDEEAPYESGGIDDDEPEPAGEDVATATGGAATGGAATATSTLPSDPRLLMPEGELRRRLKADLPSLGSLSLGAPAAGSLLNGVPMQAGPHWRVVDGSANFGTEETVGFLTRALTKVYERYPTAAPAQIGHLSARRGGPLSPHRSHQSGRDVDVGYYYVGDQSVWYKRATAENFDAARSWELIRALLTETEVEYIFVNLSVQRLLKAWALSAGEEPEWLDGLFQLGAHNPNAIIRHVHGHDTHLHVRFFNPLAEELGRRALPYLPERRIVKRREEEGLVPYRIHKGETLAILAKKFQTTVVAIQKANRLRNLKVVAGRTYLVPQKRVVKSTVPIRTTPRAGKPRRSLPPRRLPPHRRGPTSKTPKG